MKQSRLSFLIVGFLVLLAWPSAGRAFHTWKKERLANGLTVLVVEKPGAPVVSVTLLVTHGATNDPPEKRGLASLTGRLLTAGASQRSGEQMTERIAALGGEFVADVSFDSTTLDWTVLKEDLTPALALLADVVQHPVFPPAEVERERKAMMAEHPAKAEEAPTAFLLRHFFGAGSYGVPVSGEAASLTRIKRQDVVQFHRRTYRPEETILATAGAVTLEEVMTLAKKYFGDWSASEKTTESLPTLSVKKEPAVLVANRPLAQATVRLAFVGAPEASPDTPALVLLSYVLAGSAESRLEQKLREQKAWVYDVWSDAESFRQTALFSIGMSVPYEVLLPALEETIRELTRLQAEPVSAAELARAKQELATRFYFETEQVRDISRFAAKHEASTHGREPPDHALDALRSVTADAVQRVARIYLGPRQVVVTVLGDSQAVGKYAPSLAQGKLPSWPLQSEANEQHATEARSSWMTPEEPSGAQGGNPQ